MTAGLHRRLATTTSWYFVGLGATAALIPATLPAFATALVVPVESLLPAVPGLFLGLLVGVISTPVAARHISLMTVLRCGATAQAAGAALVALAPTSTWFIVAATIAGVGFGAVESAGTAVTRILNNADTTRRLIVLTVLVGAAATVTPLIALVLDASGLIRLAPVAVAAVHATALLVSRGTEVPPSPNESAAPQFRTTAPRGTLFPVTLLAAALFCYVGGESVLSGWPAVTLTELLDAGASIAALGTSAFWFLITSGRLLGIATGKRWRPSTAAQLCCLITTVALTLSTLVAGNPAVALGFIAVAVVACGPCYALILGIAVTETLNRRAVSVSSTLVAIGACGGASIPLLAIAVIAPSITGAISFGTALLLLTLARRESASRSQLI